eukprot:TRINITY_DN6456_c0_g1_i2.p1 TRINITY_DN6456_c0_g1~~TRINITY_DN6456_c0_g1_i2.p1  ORF type:complete len:1006 (+),score=242.28 TRINITY_DN6456_c0_g1_i2:497-3514(+)
MSQDRGSGSGFSIGSARRARGVEGGTSPITSNTPPRTPMSVRNDGQSSRGPGSEEIDAEVSEIRARCHTQELSSSLKEVKLNIAGQEDLATAVSVALFNGETSPTSASQKSPSSEDSSPRSKKKRMARKPTDGTIQPPSTLAVSGTTSSGHISPNASTPPPRPKSPAPRSPPQRPPPPRQGKTPSPPVQTTKPRSPPQSPHSPQKSPLMTVTAPHATVADDSEPLPPSPDVCDPDDLMGSMSDDWTVECETLVEAPKEEKATDYYQPKIDKHVFLDFDEEGTMLADDAEPTQYQANYSTLPPGVEVGTPGAVDLSLGMSRPRKEKKKKRTKSTKHIKRPPPSGPNGLRTVVSLATVTHERFIAGTAEQSTKVSLRDVFTKPHMFDFFKQCLVKYAAIENLDFYVEATEFQLTGEHDKHHAKEIFDQFVSEKARQQVNLDAGLRNGIRSNLNKDVVPITLFEGAMTYVLDLMHLDLVPKFVRSPFYEAYLKDCKGKEEKPLKGKGRPGLLGGGDDGDAEASTFSPAAKTKSRIWGGKWREVKKDTSNETLKYSFSNGKVEVQDANWVTPSSQKVSCYVVRIASPKVEEYILRSFLVRKSCLLDLLTQYDLFDTFKSFLNGIASSQILDCLTKTLDFQASFDSTGQAEKNPMLAMVIYEMYIKEDASNHVPMATAYTATIRDRVADNNLSGDMFEEATLTILEDIQNDIIPMFMASDFYAQYQTENFGSGNADASSAVPLPIDRMSGQEGRKEDEGHITNVKSGARIKRKASVSKIFKKSMQHTGGVDEERRTPLHRAAESGDVEEVRECLKPKNVQTKNVQINATDRYGFTALHAAAKGGHIDVCSLLLDHGADLSIQTHSGVLALHYFSDLHEENPGMTARLLGLMSRAMQGRMCVNHRSVKGETPLHYACFGKSPLIVAEFLLQKGASPNVPNRRGNTALHNCIFSHLDSHVALLLKHGADPNSPHPQHVSCIDVGMQTPSTKAILEPYMKRGRSGNNPVPVQR